MSRRVWPLLLLVVLSTLSGPTPARAGVVAAAATGPLTAAVLSDPRSPNSHYARSVADGAVVATDAGGVTAGVGDTALEPAAGTRLAPGRSALPDTASVHAGNCGPASAGFIGGYLDIYEAAYSDLGRLTSFAADLSVDCGSGSGATVQLRLSSSVPFASTSSAVVAGSSYGSDNGTAVVTFTNDGTATTHPIGTLLTAPYDGTGAPPAGASVTSDGCRGTTLLPGDSCEVRASSPAYGTTVRLQVPELDGLESRPDLPPAVHAAGTVNSWQRPAAVATTQASPGVDGVAVRWTSARTDPGAAGWQVEREAASGWVALSRVSFPSYADTSAQPGTAARYRITPIGEAGPDPTGAAITATAAPLSGWATPAGAVTYGSVDGSARVTGGDLSVDALGARISPRQGEHSNLGLGLPGLGWRLGTFTLGQDANAYLSDDYGRDTTVLAGSLHVTRLVQRADGTPVELAAYLTDPPRAGGASRVRAVLVVGTVPTSLPGYVVAEFASTGQLPWARVSPHRLDTPYVPGMVFDAPVVLRNLGGAATAVTGAATTSAFVTPEQPTAWSLVRTCAGPLAPAATCSTAVQVASSGDRYPHGRATWTTSGGQTTSVLMLGDADMSQAPAVSASAAALVQRDVTVTTQTSDPQGDPVTLSCRLDAGPWRACGTFTALPNGLHTITVFGTDPGGHMSAWQRLSVRADSTGPVTTLTSPAAVQFTTKPTLRWTSTDSGGSGIASYDVRYRLASPSGTWSAVLSPAAWQHLTSPSLTPQLTAGYQYCFAVRARDRAGNVGAYSPERCTAIVLDDRSLSASSSWSRGTGSAYAYNTWTSARRTGASLTRGSVQERRLAVVATTCATCGSLDVFHGGVRLGRVSLRTSTTRYRQVLWLPLQSRTRTGTVTLRSVTNSLVIVDGIAVQH